LPFCSTCGAQIENGTTCAKCAATSTAPPPAAPSANSELSDHLAGMLAYFRFIPAVVFLVLEPYNKRRFVRFHAVQCLLLTAAFAAAGIVLAIVASIPFLGLITIPLHFVLWIGGLILWVILILKAYRGEMYKLPVIGDMAERQAGA
jgi:uncharacterized membrane protein